MQAVPGDQGADTGVQQVVRFRPGARVRGQQRVDVRQLEGTPDPTSEAGGSEIGLRVVRPIWQDIQNEMMNRFETMSIEDLCDRARREGIQSEAQQVPDFSI